MSYEVEYFEFMALDRSLSPEELEELYEVLPQAEVAPDRMVLNSEHGGLSERYALECLHTWFDAMVHWIGGDPCRVALRFPTRTVGTRTLRPFRLEAEGAGVECEVRDPWTVLDMWSAGAEDMDYSDAEVALEGLVGLRAEIAHGDLRGPYLAWLAALRAWELSDDAEEAFASALEPPVPPGLGEPTDPQRRLVEFLGVDADLLAVAARASGPAPRPSVRTVRASVAALDPAVKDELLVGLVLGEEATVRAQLTRVLTPGRAMPDPARRRTAAELLDEADALRIARDRAAGRLGPS